MIFSPQSKWKQWTFYATVRDLFIHHTQKIYVQGSQDVTKILKNMNTVDQNSEEPTTKISTKKDDEIK